MARKDRMSGNEAVSFAIRQINPDVMPAFPITPSTEIPQMVSTYIANGEIDTEFVPVESEHSAMSAAIGSEAAGARTLTATSSAGLALMWEELLLAASNRMPIALALVNRTLSGPININCDHSDGMGARDTGWIQIYAENNQEAYDNFIQAYPIAERILIKSWKTNRSWTIFCDKLCNGSKEKSRNRIRKCERCSLEGCKRI